MQRYVTLNEDNNTIKQISDTQFEGSVMVFVDPSKESTFIHSPFLCWIENKDGNNILHIPEDAPAPSYEQKIEDFKKRISDLEGSDSKHTSQLEEAENKLKASQASTEQFKQLYMSVIKQFKALQAQNGQLTGQINSLMNTVTEANNAKDKANAEKDEANKEKDEANASKDVKQDDGNKPSNNEGEKQGTEVKDEQNNQTQTPSAPSGYSVQQ